LGLTIKNCEITGNKAISYGGGIELKNDGVSLIRNCTIADNCADKEGGGIYVHSDNNDVVVKNCILWGNEANEGGAQVASDLNHIEISYTDGDGCGGSGSWGWNPNWDYGNNNDVDPCLVGPGSWTLDCSDANAVWVSGDYHLDPCSACIDDGDPNDPNSSTEEVDIDREPRVNNGIVDMGSDERYCFPYDHEHHEEWLLVGLPECWCYPRQCHGDADGAYQGKFKYWVSTKDQAIFNAAWNKPYSEMIDANGDPCTTNGIPWICADFDHEAQGKFKYRVSTNDQAIMNTNWHINNGPNDNCFDPNCCD
jgi:hypothetical protein